MDIFDLVKNRRSVRAYQDKKISDGELEEIFETARFAPSAHNAQPYKIVVVKDKKKKELLAQSSAQLFIAKAPVILAAVALDKTNPYCPIDIAIAMDHISLLAWERGIGTCWIGTIRNDEIDQIIGAPAGAKTVVLMSMGYPPVADASGGRPAEREIPKRRKVLDELVSFEKFS